MAEMFAPTVAVAGINAVGVPAIASGTMLTGPSLATGPVSVTAAHRASTTTLNQPVVALPGVINVFTTRIASTLSLRLPSVINLGAAGFPEILTSELVSTLANTMGAKLQTGLLVSTLANVLDAELQTGLLVSLEPANILKEVA